MRYDEIINPENSDQEIVIEKDPNFPLFYKKLGIAMLRCEKVPASAKEHSNPGDDHE